MRSKLSRRDHPPTDVPFPPPVDNLEGRAFSATRRECGAHKGTEVREDIVVALDLSRSLVTGDSPNFATAIVGRTVRPREHRRRLRRVRAFRRRPQPLPGPAKRNHLQYAGLPFLRPEDRCNNLGGIFVITAPICAPYRQILPGGNYPDRSGTILRNRTSEEVPFRNTKRPRKRPFGRWSQEWDLNPRPADYESAALPTELSWRQEDIL